MLASKEKPTVVMIVVSLENSEESETRYISGKTVKEVVAELFGEKIEKVKKPRAKRRTRQEIQSDKEGEETVTAGPEVATKADHNPKGGGKAVWA